MANGIKEALRDDLIEGLHAHFRACKNIHKSEKCIRLDTANHVPCGCQYVENIRQQIQWITETLNANPN